ncbi:hypothetical protein JCM3766R1_007200 [Sporobolomyces carnicolor]
MEASSSNAALLYAVSSTVFIAVVASAVSLISSSSSSSSSPSSLRSRNRVALVSLSLSLGSTLALALDGACGLVATVGQQRRGAIAAGAAGAIALLLSTVLQVVLLSFDRASSAVARARGIVHLVFDLSLAVRLFCKPSKDDGDRVECEGTDRPSTLAQNQAQQHEQPRVSSLVVIQLLSSIVASILLIAMPVLPNYVAIDNRGGRRHAAPSVFGSTTTPNGSVAMSFVVVARWTATLLQLSARFEPSRTGDVESAGSTVRPVSDDKRTAERNDDRGSVTTTVERMTSEGESRMFKVRAAGIRSSSLSSSASSLLLAKRTSQGTLPSIEVATMGGGGERTFSSRSRSHSVSSLLSSFGANLPPPIREECERSQSSEELEPSSSDDGENSSTQGEEEEEDYVRTETYPVPSRGGRPQQQQQQQQENPSSSVRPRSASSPEPLYSPHPPVVPSRTPSPIATRTRKDAGRLARPVLIDRSHSSPALVLSKYKSDKNEDDDAGRDSVVELDEEEDSYHSAAGFDTPARTPPPFAAPSTPPSPTTTKSGTRPSLRSLFTCPTSPAANHHHGGRRASSSSSTGTGGDSSPTNGFRSYYHYYSGGRGLQRRASATSSNTMSSLLRAAGGGGSSPQAQQVTRKTPTLEIETDEEDPFATVQASEAIEATRKVEAWARTRTRGRDHDDDFDDDEGGFEEDLEIVSPTATTSRRRPTTIETRERRQQRRLGSPIRITTSALEHLQDHSLHPRRRSSATTTHSHSHSLLLNEVSFGSRRPAVLSPPRRSLRKTPPPPPPAPVTPPYRFGKSFAPSSSPTSRSSSSQPLFSRERSLSSSSLLEQHGRDELKPTTTTTTPPASATRLLEAIGLGHTDHRGRGDSNEKNEPPRASFDEDDGSTTWHNRPWSTSHTLSSPSPRDERSRRRGGAGRGDRNRTSAPLPSSSSSAASSSSPRVSPVHRFFFSFARRPSTTSTSGRVKLFSPSADTEEEEEEVSTRPPGARRVPDSPTTMKTTTMRRGSRASSTTSFNLSKGLGRRRRGGGTGGGGGGLGSRRGSASSAFVTSRPSWSSLLRSGGGGVGSTRRLSVEGGGVVRRETMTTKPFRRSASSDLSFMCRGESSARTSREEIEGGGGSSYHTSSSVRREGARRSVAASLDFEIGADATTTTTASFMSSNEDENDQVSAEESGQKDSSALVEVSDFATASRSPRTTNWWSSLPPPPRHSSPLSSSRRLRRPRPRSSSAPPVSSVPVSGSDSTNLGDLSSSSSSSDVEVRSNVGANRRRRREITTSRSLPQLARLSDYQLETPARVSPIGTLLFETESAHEEEEGGGGDAIMRSATITTTTAMDVLHLAPPISLSSLSSSSKHDDEEEDESGDRTINEGDVRELTALCETLLLDSPETPGFSESFSPTTKSSSSTIDTPVSSPSYYYHEQFPLSSPLESNDNDDPHHRHHDHLGFEPSSPRPSTSSFSLDSVNRWNAIDTSRGGAIDWRRSTKQQLLSGRYHRGGGRGGGGTMLDYWLEAEADRSCGIGRHGNNDLIGAQQGEEAAEYIACGESDQMI